MSPTITRYMLILILLLSWELLPRMGIVPVLFLPPLTSAVDVLISKFDEYAYHTWITFHEIGVSLIFACGGGVLVGLTLGASGFGRKLMLPIVSSLFAIPMVVLYPLFTAWFGIGSESKIVFASVYGFLPTVLGTAAGARTVDSSLITVARSMGATRLQQITRVYLPATLPTVLSSFRIGGALVIVGVIVAQMLAATGGVGFLISKYRTMLQSADVFAGILLVLALAVLFDYGVQRLERAVGR